jgi:hypothetical protein
MKRVALNARAGSASGPGASDPSRVCKSPFSVSLDGFLGFVFRNFVCFQLLRRFDSAFSSSLFARSSPRMRPVPIQSIRAELRCFLRECVGTAPMFFRCARACSIFKDQPGNMRFAHSPISTPREYTLGVGLLIGL